jgi:WD40 repeat protein
MKEYSSLFTKTTIICLVTVIFCGCTNPKSENTGYTIESFDISPDGKSMVLSVESDGQSSLYESTINGVIVKSLIKSQKEVSVYNPKFSNDGSKVVFISAFKNNNNGAVNILDLRDLGLKQITGNNTIVRQAIFSDDAKHIYFTQANEYASYSPLASKSAHDFDIFSVIENGDSLKKISNLKAYSLSNLSDIGKNRLIFDMQGNMNGVFLYDLKHKILSGVSIIDDSLSYSKGYTNPILINDSTLICKSYSTLVKVDLVKKIEKVILPYNPQSINTIRYNKSLHRIFFLRKNANTVIYSVNVNGTNLKMTKIKISQP